MKGTTNLSEKKVGGLKSVAEILNRLERSTEEFIMERIEEEDSELADGIRKLMFIFDDLLNIDDKGIQAVLKEVSSEELSLSLKTANEAMREKIFKNMSERAATLIKENMEYMGPVRVSDVEQSQQRIVDAVRRLEEAGEVIISGRGGEEEIIV